MPENKVDFILGTMTFGESVFGSDAEKIIESYRCLGGTELDTAYVYNNGKSELIIGEVLEKTGKGSLKVSTKVNPRITGRLDGDAAVSQLEESLLRLRLDSVDTFYLHFPDPVTPIDSVLAACDSLHRRGLFANLGLSNFPAWLVAEVYNHCKSHGYVLPTVYEGIYNPLTRAAEAELDFALDYYGIRFTAYNPLCGGLLTGKYKGFDDAPSDGRFTHRPNYKNRYWKPSFFSAVAFLEAECEKCGIGLIEAAYRWLCFHSMLKAGRGDAVIVGVSKPEQLAANIRAAENGPLPGELTAAFDKAWDMCKSDSPEYFRFYGTGAN